MVRAGKSSESHGKGVASGQRLDEDGAALLAGQVRLLYQQSPSTFIGSLANAAILGYVVQRHVGAALVGTWFAALALLTLGRYCLVAVYHRKKPAIGESTGWARRFLVGVVLSGCLWGAAGTLFFIQGSPVHQVFLAFALGGMAASGASTLCSYRRAYPAFLLPSLIPYAMETVSQGDEVHLAMGLMLLLFGAMMLVIAQRMHLMVAESLRIGLRNTDLVRELLNARDRQEAVNQELKTQIAEREQAERLLQSAYEKMEQRVRERTLELDLSNKILHREKELFRVTIASIGDAVIATDDRGNIRFLNPVAEALTGLSAEESIGLPLRKVFRTLDEESREPADDVVQSVVSAAPGAEEAKPLVLVRPDGAEFAIDYTLAPIRDGSDASSGAVLVFRDVSAQRKLAQELSYQATHDELTGLVNRREFERRLARVLKTIGPHDPHALLYLDLDQFKVVNDQCGHTAGDELLRQVATRLQAKIRTRDTLARLGGDEFGILLEHCRQDEASRIAQNLREQVQKFRFAWGDKNFGIAVSIGLFPITERGATLGSVLGAADSACYAAKAAGRNRVHLYQPDDRELLERKGDRRWLPRIQQALAEGRFRLFVQPVVPWAPGQHDAPYGEILLRLRDKEGGLIMPGAFLPAAERYEQIVAIDRWVVSQSLEWLKAGQPTVSDRVFGINLSAQALADENFRDFVIERVTKSGVDPSSVCFEIRESAAISDFSSARHFIATLREVGCRFALDGFGVGMSSFGYLKTLAVDFLKIDGRLVQDMLKNPVDQSVIEAIHRIGHVMGVKTIAEWVETSELSSALQSIGIDYGQGYRLGEPRAVADFLATPPGRA